MLFLSYSFFSNIYLVIVAFWLRRLVSSQREMLATWCTSTSSSSSSSVLSSRWIFSLVLSSTISTCRRKELASSEYYVSKPVLFGLRQLIFNTRKQHIFPKECTLMHLVLRIFKSTLWTEKSTKMFLWYLAQNSVNSDKIWYTLSWINLRYSSLNVFQLTWVMSLHYLVKLSVAFCKWTAMELRTPNVFLSHRLQNQADSDKLLYLLSWIYLLHSIINVFYLA